MRITIDPKKLEVLMASDVYKAIQTAADEKRVAAHRAAVDALLAKQSDTAAITAARTAFEEARAKFEPIEANYRKARIALSAKESNLRDLEWSHDHTGNRLRNVAASHLLPVVHATESALHFAAHEIRNALNVQTTAQRDFRGAYQNRYESNQAAIDEALAQVQTMRELIDRFTFEPLPETEIIELLSTEARRLIELAKVCGAMVAHHLPAEIRHGLYIEKPESKERKVFVLPRN